MTYEISIPSGLGKVVLHVLRDHAGREQAIGRDALVKAIHYRTASFYHERLVRECIKQLRRQGHLICSMPGSDGGYYMASTKQEFDDFDQAEFGAKIADMNETRQAMLRAARVQFGEPVVQERLL